MKKGKPVIVKIGFDVQEIFAISEVNMDYQMTVYFRQTWRGVLQDYFHSKTKKYYRSEISPSNGQLLVELRYVLYKVGLGSKFLFGFTCLSCDLELVRQRKWPYINNFVKFSFHWILQEKALAINKSPAYSRLKSGQKSVLT